MMTYAHVPSILNVWTNYGDPRLYSNGENWSNHKNAVNIAPGLAIPYFTDYRSMGTIGRIAAFQLNFWGNTKIGRSIP
jgi:hypothetical protein